MMCDRLIKYIRFNGYVSMLRSLRRTKPFARIRSDMHHLHITSATRMNIITIIINRTHHLLHDDFALRRVHVHQ